MSVCDVFRLEKKSTPLSVSRPIETSNIPSSVNREQLHASPADRTGARQQPHVTAASPTVAQQHRPPEPVSAPLDNNPEQQLSKNSSLQYQLGLYPQQLSSSNISPTCAPQQPQSSPANDALRVTSPKQMISGPTIRPSEPVSPPLANSPKHQMMQNSSQHRHLQPYPQPLSNSHNNPMYMFFPQQRVSSPQNDVGQTAQAVRGPSPEQVTTGKDAPRPTLRGSPVKPFASPAEQHVYDRPALNQQHTPVYRYHQYSQPADSFDQYRYHNVTSVSHRHDPYRQNIPLSYHDSQPKLGLLTSNIDGMNLQKTASRSNSCREQPPASNYDVVHNNSPAVQTHRISPQRDMLAVRNGRSQSGERMPSFGNGPNPRQQNVRLNDPYRLHYPAVDGSSQVYHERVRSALLPSQENDINNRRRIYGTDHANNNTPARYAGIPAARGLSPAVSRSPQYSVPISHIRQNSEVFRYPSPAYDVQHSASPGLLPSAEYRRSDFRNPVSESQYSRGRQVCTAYVVCSMLCSHCCRNNLVIKN